MRCPLDYRFIVVRFHHRFLDSFFNFRAPICPYIPHYIIRFVADFGSAAGIVAVNEGGQFTEGETMGRLLLDEIEMAAADLDDCLFHSALFQLLYNFLFKFPCYLTCPGALFKLPGALRTRPRHAPSEHRLD